MMNYAAMAKKEIRDVIRTNNKHLRNIARGDADNRFLNTDAIDHFRKQSLAALDELEKRNPTFEDLQLRQSAMAAWNRAYDVINRHDGAVEWLNRDDRYIFTTNDRKTDDR